MTRFFVSPEELGSDHIQLVGENAAQPRILGLPPASRRQVDPPGQVAGRRHIAHRVRDRPERTSDAASRRKGDRQRAPPGLGKPSGGDDRAASHHEGRAVRTRSDRC